MRALYLIKHHGKQIWGNMGKRIVARHQGVHELGRNRPPRFPPRKRELLMPGGFQIRAGLAMSWVANQLVVP
jgi:hypothetical protein